MSDLTIKVDDLLDYFPKNIYDYYHGCGPLTWVLDFEPFMDNLADKLGITKAELGDLYDEARARSINVSR